MRELLYTVKEISKLSGVTVKTLHHYHKIGLLLPCQISDAGYRLYGRKELERLQEILFYRELDFSLVKIRQLLENDPERLSILSDQREQLLDRMHRLARLIDTLDASIASTTKGEAMDTKKMFNGFKNEEEWQAALAEQNQYLSETYNYDLLGNKKIDVEGMNEQAMEAIRFMNGMATSLKEGLKHDDEKVRLLIQVHLDFLNINGHITRASDFAAQSRFFLNDDFHRNMLESQQTGLAYYLYAAAEAFAAT